MKKQREISNTSKWRIETNIEFQSLKLNDQNSLSVSMIVQWLIEIKNFVSDLLDWVEPSVIQYYK